MRGRVFSDGQSRRCPGRAASAVALLLVAAVAGCNESADSPSSPNPEAALAATASTPLSFIEVSTGGFHSCGVAVDQRAYCWGLNDDGQLGHGDTLRRSRPVPVAGGLRFLHVSASYIHTCGVTTDSLAYCWGRGEDGRLGNGARRNRLTPVAVAGGRHFSEVNTGDFHTCAVTAAHRVYCWGDNRWGQIGDGTLTDRLSPVPVGGTLRFRRVVSGASHTCAVSTVDRGYCWGDNQSGAVGDGSSSAGRLVPTAVAGGLSFRQVTAGTGYSCGLTTQSRGYCWGSSGGQVRREPGAVTVGGGASLSQIVAGGGHHCAVTTGHQAYCWGYNFTGALGDGTEIDRLTPVAVVGGILFSGVSPGSGYHTCGVTTGRRVYCWGHNAYGQLGDGTSTGPETCEYQLPCSRKPVAVVGVS
jgi:alpha-tubulin suppressor-like RCC1 family protein